MKDKDVKIVGGTVFQISHKNVFILGSDGIIYHIDRQKQTNFKDHKWKEGAVVSIFYKKPNGMHPIVTAVFPPDQIGQELTNITNEMAC